jgi:energy-coupling factor transporter ATP-binding protein EcfA2
MIENVRVSNFKCIKEEYLENLTPIVGIWGRNGSGKSSLLQAIIWVLMNAGKLDTSILSLGMPKEVIYGHNFDEKCSVNVTLNGQKYQYEIVREGIGHSGPGVTYAGVRYFPPWRYISKRSSQINLRINSHLGIKGPGIHAFIHHFLHGLLGNIQRGDKEAEIIYEKINLWSEKIGLGKLLDTQLGSTEVSGTYFDEIMNLEVPIVDGGFGGNSFLPILLEGYSFTEGILLIEEPEISLHPAAQSEVLDFFVEMAVERHHQIIYTSHSEYIVKKIARLLKEEKLSQDLISVYVARKDDETGTIFEKKSNDELVSRFEKNQEIISELTRRT